MVHDYQLDVMLLYIDNKNEVKMFIRIWDIDSCLENN